MSGYRLGGAVVVALNLCVVLGGCIAPLPSPDLVIAPAPRLDNGGKFLSPYTRDGTVALWVDKGINAKTGAVIGRTVGAYIGQKALEQVPFVGGLLGAVAGDAIGRKVAIAACGGWDYIRSTSDTSFDSSDDMAVYVYATYAGKSEHYGEVVQAAWAVYPRVKKRWHGAIRRAPRRQTP